MIAATMEADEYWRLHPTDWRKTRIYAHTTSRALPTCDISLGSLTLLAPEAGDVVELILFNDQWLPTLLLCNYLICDYNLYSCNV
jgi:hypothetical protein